MGFPENLKELREKSQFSKIELADAIGVHVVQYRRYENGTSQPTLDIIKKMALTLSVSTDSIVFGSDKIGPDKDLTMHFETIKNMASEDKKIAKALLDGLILRYQAKVLSKAT